MKKELKEKKKKLEKKYLDYFYDVVGFLAKQNLSMFAFYQLRDDALEAIYDAQENGDDPKSAFHRGYEIYYQKKINNLPKKNIVEKIGELCFSFFALFLALSLFVYLYRFGIKDVLFYSEGMYLYITASSISNMLIYGFLGALLSIYLQKNDKKTKNISAAITAGIGIALIVCFMIIGANNPKPLKLNMIIVFAVCIVISGGGLALEILISKKKCLKNQK